MGYRARRNRLVAQGICAWCRRNRVLPDTDYCATCYPRMQVVRAQRARQRWDWDAKMLRALRDRLMITTRELGARLGISHNAMDKHLRPGHRVGDRRTLDALDEIEAALFQETGIATIEWLAGQQVAEKLWHDEQDERKAQ